MNSKTNYLYLMLIIGTLILLISKTVLAVQPVTWINQVNVTVAGNTIQKNTGGCTDCANAGATSQQQITSGNGYVEFTATSDGNGYIGLGTNTSNSTSNQEINFGISFGNGGWTIRELNYTYRTEGTYAVGDTFRIAIVGSQVKYYKNGTSEIYTSTTSPTYPLVVDTSLWYEFGNPVNKVANVMIETGQAQPIPTPPTLISNRCSSYAAPSIPTQLRTFYLNADSGNDSNDGLTPATAWKTLQKANNTAVAGDLFLLRGVFGVIPGNSDGQWINPVNSGTATNKIVYRKEPGQIAVIETGLYDGGVVLTNGQSHIVIDGFEIRNVNSPVLLTNNTNNIWLRNLYIHNSGGIFLRSSQNNRIEDSVLVDIGNPQTNEGDSVLLLADPTGNTNGSDNNTVVRNYFGNAGHGAYDDTVQGASAGFNDNNIVAQNIFNNQWATNVIVSGRGIGTLVECNEIKNASQNTPNPTLVYPRPGIQYSGDNGIIRYNRVFNNKSYGIIIQGYIFGTTQEQYPENNQIYHNTFVSNGSAGLFIGINDAGYPSAQAYVRNNTFENNIFWNNGGYDGANGQFYDIVADCYTANSPWTPGFTDGNVFRYNNTSNLPFFLVVRNASGGGNLYYDTPALAQAANPTWINNTRLNPLFTNSTTNDYSLLSNSSMIDVGRLIPGVSYNGSAPDLGAIESNTVTTAPNAPSNLVGTVMSTTSVKLDWTDNSNNETSFIVQRCSGASCTNFATVTGGTIATNTITFTNTGLTNGTTYRYRIGAANSVGTNYSNILTITCGLPTAPTGLAGVINSSSQITLNWTDTSNNEAGFRIERCTGQTCTTYTQIATVGIGIATFANSGLTANTYYRYRVRAYNTAGNSAYTSVVTVRTNP
jgi:hypothetical protein